MTASLKLKTKRLSIVGISDISLDQVVDYHIINNDHLRLNGGFVPSTRQQVIDAVDGWQNNIASNVEVRFFILLENELIGIVGVTNLVRGAFQAAYFGYHLAELAQGKGYMTEALEEIIQFSFSALNLHRLMANYRPNNAASGRVLEKLGFVKEGFSEKYLLVDGVWEDHILTGLRNDQWKNDF